MKAKDIFMNALHVHVYCLMFTLKLYITVCFNVYIFHLYHIFKKMFTITQYTYYTNQPEI